MKKLLALLLALFMLFAFAACGDGDSDNKDGSKKKFDSIEDKADDFLDRFEDLIDDLEDAIEDNDEDEIEKLEKKIDDLEDEYEEILEELEDEDEDLVEEFEEDIAKLGEKVSELYDDNTGNAVETLPPSADNSSTNNKVETAVPEDSRTLQSYINSIQSQLDEVLDVYAQQGLSIQVVARGNSLAYVYRYTIDIADIATARQQLASALAMQASTFENVLKELKNEVPSAESVIVEYQAKDGSVIYSKEYK